MRFFPYPINAVIHDGTVIYPPTQPGTNSGRTRGISVTSLPDENTPVHGDAINGPVPHDEIGPMSERNPGIKNAFNPNFNNDICDNGPDVVNIWNLNKPMTEIFIKTPQDKKSKFPTLNSPPTPPYTDKTPADTTYASADMLTTTIPAQPHTTSAFHCPDTKIYGETDMTNKKTTHFLSVTKDNLADV
ncbi:hypothetical protein MHU86_9069 [Fragilaria crotonensis]|nr:hypothetical protein MHU86_9069 [Fragilaria crotonensis]